MAEVKQRPLLQSEKLRLERLLKRADRNGRRGVRFLTFGLGLTVATFAGISLAVEGPSPFLWILGLTSTLACSVVGYVWAKWEWRQSRCGLAEALSNGQAREIRIEPRRICQLSGWEDLGDGFAFEVEGPQVIFYFGQDSRSLSHRFPREIITIVLIETSQGEIVEEIVSAEGKSMTIERSLSPDAMRSLRLPSRLELHPGTLDDIEALLVSSEAP